jgi:fatty acid kinase fatty acid binding subunit
VPAPAIVTDTTHYLPRELVTANELHEVSLYINRDGEQEPESEIDDYDAYYERLRSADRLPTTSQPSIGDFLAVWEPLLAEGREIVSVHLSAGISGTYQAALQAKERLESEHRGGERVRVLDSATAAGGLGLIVLAAAGAARSGENGAGVLARATEARDALKLWFAVDTLEFLRRGGRVGAAQAWLGGALKIKPILSIESEITAIERVRTSGRAVERMIEYAASRAADGADAWVIQHIQDPERAEMLVERGREIFGKDPVFCSEIGPVIGTHAGPGLLGVGGIPTSVLRGAALTTD